MIKKRLRFVAERPGTAEVLSNRNRDFISTIHICTYVHIIFAQLQQNMPNVMYIMQSPIFAENGKRESLCKAHLSGIHSSQFDVSRHFFSLSTIFLDMFVLRI
jgi:hypothetical protein